MKTLYVLLSLLILPRVYAISPVTVASKPIPVEVKIDPWVGYPLLKHIASCESWGDPNKEPRQFLLDGSVLRGFPNPEDIGLGQINLPTWGSEAKKLGFNLFTYDGNLAMTKWIFDLYGSEPWSWSKGCWGEYQ